MFSQFIHKVHITITGLVQGVSFRYFTVLKAQELGVCGWVKNTQDGKVEIEAEGTKRSLEALVSWCKKGLPPAQVKKVDAVLNKGTKNFLLLR
jgi:acylphosphatase